MDRVTATAVACLFAVACGGDGEPRTSAQTAQPAAQNSPPVIESVSLTPSDPRPGQQITAQVNAVDPDGDRITLDYRWRVSGMPVESANGQPSLHVEGKETGGSIEVTVIARDEHGESAPQTASARIGNLPPTIIQVELKPQGGQVTAGEDLTASPVARDPEGDPIEFRYQWRVNHETAMVNGPTLPASMFKRGDKIVLDVVASDGQNESALLTTLPIEVVNAPPKIVSKPGAIDNDGTFRYAVKAEDPDGDRVLRYRLAKAPPGMTIGFDDGQIRWSPPANAAGSHDVEVEVADRFGATAKQDFALNVAFSTDTEEKTAAKEGAKPKTEARADAPAKKASDSDF
jgi:hypothetical protein